MTHNLCRHREGLGRSEGDSRLGFLAMPERVAIAAAFSVGRNSFAVVVVGGSCRSSFMQAQGAHGRSNEEVTAHLEEEQ